MLDPIRAYRHAYAALTPAPGDEGDFVPGFLSLNGVTFLPLSGSPPPATCLRGGSEALIRHYHQVPHQDQESSGERKFPDTNERDVVPYLSCTCGYYSYKVKDHEWSAHTIAWDVEVDLSGKIIEHTVGYRSQYCQIIAAVPAVCGDCCWDTPTWYLRASSGLLTPSCEAHLGLPRPYMRGSEFPPLPVATVLNLFATVLR